MTKYNEEQVVKIAKRYKNSKRKYLLVDPLQAKHIPVSPSKALKLMDDLGKAVRGKYPEAFWVIGFAETATAIASAVAENMADCFYVQTTREDIVGEYLKFEEQHSHAVEQRLCIKNIAEAISDSPQIIFVDDEISTGNTLLNIVNCLRGRHPEISDKKIVIASVIDRVSDENRKKLADNNVDCISLCKIEERDYEDDISNIDAKAPDPQYFGTGIYLSHTTIETDNKILDPRTGLKMSDYKKSLDAFSDEAMVHINVQSGEKILVLGTEECMYPALLLGKKIEAKYNVEVYCHASTRSPIGVSAQEDYPINNGYKINSFYDAGRVNYIYNIKKYDRVFVVTDSKKDTNAMNSLCAVLKEHGCGEIILIRG